MHREVEDAPIAVEDVLRAVAVVHVPVQDGDPVETSRKGVPGRNSRVVREAEPHPVIPPRVVARRAGDGEGRLAGEGTLDRRAGGPARESGRLPGTRADRGIQAEVALSRRGHLSQAVQIRCIVDSERGLLSGRDYTGATPRERRFARPSRPLRGPQGTSPGIPRRRGRLRGPSRPGHSRRANFSRSRVTITISAFCRAPAF